MRRELGSAAALGLPPGEETIQLSMSYDTTEPEHLAASDPRVFLHVLKKLHSLAVVAR